MKPQFAMQQLSTAVPADFADVTLVLTDMDDTLTRHGRLSADTYRALERLIGAGVHIIPVTAAPAGWCDQMALMWPVTAVVGENGGFAFRRKGARVERYYWDDPISRRVSLEHLLATANEIIGLRPGLTLADDQPFRLTSVAFNRPSNNAVAAEVAAELSETGRAAINSIWVLGWGGDYDKLSAARRFVPELAGLDVDEDAERIIYVGDSGNDAPMFAHFPKSAGVSTVIEHLSDIPKQPTWITKGPGGEGFVEVAEAILAARRQG